MVTVTFLNFQLSLYVYDSHKESPVDIISLKIYNNFVFHYFLNIEFALVM